MKRIEDLDESDWEPLVSAIQGKICTPFIGAGAAADRLPLGAELAHCMAKQSKYPFDDAGNLPKVAQYRSIMGSDSVPKLEVIEMIRRRGDPDFSDPLEPHAFLASLKLPIYFTTNYDAYMATAINTCSQGRIRPVRDYCRWKRSLGKEKFDPKVKASPERPVVYHLHGVADLRFIDDEDPYNNQKCWQTLVLTEDDYVQFLANVASDSRMIPVALEGAVAGTAMLFVGYSLQDINFKVILQRIQSLMETRGPGSIRHFAVQIEPQKPRICPGEDRCMSIARRGRCSLKQGCLSFPDGPPEDHAPQGPANPTPEEAEWVDRVASYLERLYPFEKVTVFWGTSRKFCEQLSKRL